MLELASRYHDFVLALNISIDVRTDLHAICTLLVNSENFHNFYTDQHIFKLMLYLFTFIEIMWIKWYNIA